MRTAGALPSWVRTATVWALLVVALAVCRRARGGSFTQLAQAANPPEIAWGATPQTAVVGYRVELRQLNEEEAHQLQVNLQLPTTPAPPATRARLPADAPAPGARTPVSGSWQVQLLPTGVVTPAGGWLATAMNRFDESCATAQLFTVIGSACSLEIAREQLVPELGTLGRASSLRIRLTPLRWVKASEDGPWRLATRVEVNLNGAVGAAGVGAGEPTSRVWSDVLLKPSLATAVAVVLQRVGGQPAGQPGGRTAGGQGLGESVRYLVLGVTATAAVGSGWSTLAETEAGRATEAANAPRTDAAWAQLLWPDDLGAASTSPTPPTVWVGTRLSVTTVASLQKAAEDSVWQVEIERPLSAQGSQIVLQVQRFPSGQIVSGIGVADRVVWSDENPRGIGLAAEASLFPWAWSLSDGSRLTWSGQITIEGCRGKWWGEVQFGRWGKQWDSGLAVGRALCDRWTLFVRYGRNSGRASDLGGGLSGQAIGTASWQLGVRYGWRGAQG